MLLSLSCFPLHVQNRDSHTGGNTEEMKEKAKQRMINDEHQQLDTGHDESLPYLWCRSAFQCGLCFTCHDRITDQLSILQNWILQNEDFKALSLACFLGEPHHFKQPCSKRMGGRVISLFRVKWNSNLTKIKESPSFKNDMCALSWP